MVVVTCQLSCTVRRCDPQAESEPHVQRMIQLMQRVCRTANAQLASFSDVRPSQTKPYDDLSLEMICDVRSTEVLYSTAANDLLDAFRNVLERNTIDTCYWLSVKSDPGLDETDLNKYSHKIEMTTYALGFMSSAAEFHTQFQFKIEYILDYGQPEAIFDYESEKFEIRFSLTKPQQLNERLTINFEHLSPWIVIHSEETFVYLNFLTTTPLQLWEDIGIKSDCLENHDKTFWVRKCTSGNDTKKIDKQLLGGCSAFMLRIDKGGPLDELLAYLSTVGGFVIHHTLINYRIPAGPYPDAPNLRSSTPNDLSSLNWLLAALYSIGYRVQHQFTQQHGRDFMLCIERTIAACRNPSELRHLQNALSRTYDILLNDSDKFLQLDRVLIYCLTLPPEVDELVHTKCRMIKRLIITPSRLLVMPPCLQHDNRIIREFDADSAVSCAFQNDDYGKFNYVAIKQDFVEEAVGSVLREGVRVADRHYEFLGCSGSQLSDNGCWLYARDALGKTAADIRSWMGDLSHIRNPGAYLARMGQCFSDTVAVELDDSVEIEWKDDDVEGGNDISGKPYCFSDGVGRISADCLNEVFKGVQETIRPSAIQIRLGGCKGMLALDPRLPGKQILVRKSMYKFQSTHRKMEVARRAKPVPLYLNRQIITILSQRKDPIPDYVFIRMLNNMLHRLADALMNEAEALTSLSQSGFSCCYSKLHKAGFNFTTDPFFKQLLRAISSARISDLKTNARIEIAPHHGRFMLGVMDELGVLEYGEVFIQYSADILPPRNEIIVHEGEVVVSKMPCLHPGDVRKLTAVDKPELSHLVDCIVFPRKVPRPHPNEMAGSDLDGDEYFVTWMPQLIFPYENEEPMDFIKGPKTELAHPVTFDDMIDFIVKYLINDKKGTISNSHLALADLVGIHDDKCKKLAKLFCHVIDYNKTGYLPPEIENGAYPKPLEYPDFMDKSDKFNYMSDKILGKLYRICRRMAAAITTIDRDESAKLGRDAASLIVDKRFLTPGYELFIPAAESLYDIYAECLDSVQLRYGIDSEAQLVSGCMIKIKGDFCRAEKKYDIEKRLHERMSDVYRFIREKFNVFARSKDHRAESVNNCEFDRLVEDGYSSNDEAEKNETPGKNFRESRRRLAAACYFITYSQKKNHLSFPWIFAENLVQILQRQRMPAPPPPLVLLSDSIDATPLSYVNAQFRDINIIRPTRDDLAKVYHMLISWGKKSRFLPRTANDTLRQIPVSHFVDVLDLMIARNADVRSSLSGRTGPILLSLMKAITNMDPNEAVNSDNVVLERSAVVNMKQQILLGYHQLARDPRAECLQDNRQGVCTRKIQILRDRWRRLQSFLQTKRRNLTSLRKFVKDEYHLIVRFDKRGQNKSVLRIKGPEQAVFDFEEEWLTEAGYEKLLSDFTLGKTI